MKIYTMIHSTKLFRKSTRFTSLLLLVLGLSACANNRSKNANVVRPEHAITKAQAIELSNNYTARYDNNSRAIGKPDNRSTWYSLDELKNYIAYIEAQGKEQGYAVDGIRFYLGAYSADNKDADKQNFTTIFLAPTGMKMGTMIERSMSSGTANQDILTIDAYNFGSGGWPPHTSYGGN